MAVLRRRGRALRKFGLTLSFQPVAAVAELEAQDADLVLLGWSSKVFDPYNQLDQFTCGSAFNVARWCDRSYDALMRQAVRTLDDERWQLERKLVEQLPTACPRSRSTSAATASRCGRACTASRGRRSASTSCWA